MSRADELRRALQQADEDYFMGVPDITDAQYQRMLDELMDLESHDPPPAVLRMSTLEKVLLVASLTTIAVLTLWG